MHLFTKITAAAPLVIGLTFAAAVPAASARADDVRVAGSCSASASAKLKLSTDDTGIETEFEVDQNVDGQRWRVVIRRNGVREVRRVMTTSAPSGSFNLETVVGDSSGTDVVRARARNLRTGEVCRAVARI